MSALMARRTGPRVRPPEPGIRIPVSPARLRLWALAALLAVAAAAALWLGVQRGGPARIVDALVAASARAGFEVRDVTVAGARLTPADAVRAAVLAGDSDAMLAIGLHAARARVEGLPLVRTASVARRWPDRLAVVIEERQPAAIFSTSAGRVVIDVEGQVLDGLDPARFPQLPLISGDGAPNQLAALQALLATQPALAAGVDSAAWRGGRRWDLRMTGGEVIALPEGYDRAEAALARFAAAHAQRPLLGQGYARFDLRVDGRMTVRLTRQPGAQLPASQGMPI